MSFSWCSEIWGKCRTSTTGPTCQKFSKILGNKYNLLYTIFGGNKFQPHILWNTISSHRMKFWDLSFPISFFADLSVIPCSQTHRLLVCDTTCSCKIMFIVISIMKVSLVGQQWHDQGWRCDHRWQQQQSMLNMVTDVLLEGSGNNAIWNCIHHKRNATHMLVFDFGGAKTECADGRWTHQPSGTVI